MKKIFFILSLLWVSIHCDAKRISNAQYWDKANTAYQQKQYDSAIFYYQQILNVQEHNAIVHYNLGNAYYKNNQVSHAVLSYERALFYQPKLKDAQDNLLLAKSRIPNAVKQIPDIFFIRWWNALTSANSANAWAVFSLLLFLSILGIIFYSSFYRKKTPIQVYFILPFVNLLFIFFTYIANQRQLHCSLAVVMNSGAMVQEPNIYKGQFMVPEATTVITGETKGNWIAVTLPDNKTGWMQKTELQFVYQPVKIR